MKKKKEEFYYKNLRNCVEIAFEEAKLLMEIIKHFNAGNIKEKLNSMHEMEQKGDAKKHKMMAALNQAFITPIEREDLVALSNDLDDIIDSIEDIILKIYICNVSKIRKDAIWMVELLLECIKALEELINELKDYKHSKNITKYIIRVNELEEKGDIMYIENMRRLYEEDDIRIIMIWQNIYDCIENCIDKCENVADIIEMIVMKNT